MADGYLFSFWFWTDLLSTSTLLLDMPAVQRALSGGSREDNASSIVRVAVRLFQLVRITRLLKVSTSATALSITQTKIFMD